MKVQHYTKANEKAVAKAQRIANETGQNMLVLTSVYGVDIFPASEFAGQSISGCYVDRIAPAK